MSIKCALNMDSEGNNEITTEFTASLMTSLETNIDKRETRHIFRSDVILEYESLTKSKLEGSPYFHNVLKNRDLNNDDHHIGNFVLNLILPFPVVGSLTGSSRGRFAKRVFFNLFDDSLFRIEEVTAGSLSEGLGLPQIVTIHGQNFQTEIPDEDKKFIFHGFPVSERASTAFAHFEQSGLSPPSFVKLKINQDFKWQRRLLRHWNTNVFLTQNGFIDRVKFTTQLKSLIKDRIFDHSIKCKDGIVPKVTFSLHGPASTTDVEGDIHNLYSTDYVVCLPCPTWPTQAKSWKYRQRVWPSKGLVRKIVRGGCHLVSKGHKGSREFKEEFIFSFSLCDKMLSKSLSLNQKRCYMLFKYIFKFHINKVPRGLASFFCKVTFLWLCETKPADEWNDESLLECLILLLGNLKRYLQQ